MIPAVTMQIPAIPLNQNGKVNRKALPEPVAAPDEAVQTEAEGYVDNRLEAELRKAAEEITGGRTPRTVPLMQAGLTSIGVIRMAVFVFDRFGVSIPVKDFGDMSLLDLENEILSVWRDGGKPAKRPDEKTAEADFAPFPLSAAQMGVYMECVKKPESTIYNLPVILQFSHETNPRRIADAVAAVMYAHPSVHVHFDMIDNRVMVVRNDSETVDVPIPEMSEQARTQYGDGFPKAFHFCEIFSGLLHVQNVMATENFFDLGGTSLLVTQVVIDASKRGYTIVFGDVFSHPTPRALASLCENQEEAPLSLRDSVIEDYDYAPINELLRKNTLESFRNGEPAALGNVLLTGATGYLSVHILRELLNSTDSKVYCLVRGDRQDAETRLKNLLVYYFESPCNELFGDRIIALEGDVTEREKLMSFSDLPIHTVINCAASVKHFSSDSGCLAVCAVSDSPVGVDTELICGGREEIETICFRPEERALLDREPDRDLAFARLWTRKASYLKLTGTGLPVPLNAFSVLPGGHPADKVEWTEHVTAHHMITVCANCGQTASFRPFGGLSSAKQEAYPSGN